MALPMPCPTACSMSLYADNLLLYRPIQSRLLNPTSRCTVQLHGSQPTSYSRTVISVSACLWLINGQPLYSYKYLGILLTSDQHMHISTLCSKARQQIGLLYRKIFWCVQSIYPLPSWICNCCLGLALTCLRTNKKLESVQLFSCS